MPADDFVPGSYSYVPPATVARHSVLPSNSKYKYKVRAITDQGKSEFSVPILGYTLVNAPQISEVAAGDCSADTQRSSQMGWNPMQEFPVDVAGSDRHPGVLQYCRRFAGAE